MISLYDRFEQALLAFDRIEAKELIAQNINDMEPFQLIEQIIAPALEKIGQDWGKGKVALSQVYMSGKICEELVETFLPPSSSEGIQQPPMAIVILADYHSLGKMIIYSALRANGIELQDWGRLDVSELVHKLKDSDIKILFISALMLPSALQVKTLRETLDQEKINVKLVVGGAPFRFDDQLWQEVGADAMGANSNEAIELAHKMIKELS